MLGLTPEPDLKSFNGNRIFVNSSGVQFSKVIGNITELNVNGGIEETDLSFCFFEICDVVRV